MYELSQIQSQTGKGIEWLIESTMMTEKLEQERLPSGNKPLPKQILKKIYVAGQHLVFETRKTAFAACWLFAIRLYGI